jgi:hypothetical protein
MNLILPMKNVGNANKEIRLQGTVDAQEESLHSAVLFGSMAYGSTVELPKITFTTKLCN